MIQIGPYTLDNNVVLAPMAGVTDLPFRNLCRQLGAGLVVSEMLTSNTQLWNSRKSQWRLKHDGETEPRSIQIAGNEPLQMAEAAKLNAKNGAQIIDINMGCPAKKVCKKAAGSALLRDTKLVADILSSTVDAADVPVTLKIRTGWSPEQRNGVEIAKIAEDSGIQALAVHGRTRACAFKGDVEYDTIAAIKEAISIPVFANGDISTPEQAQAVLQHTKADGVMIGRAAQGRPWLLGQIAHYLSTGKHLPDPDTNSLLALMEQHLIALHQHYGEYMGLRIARKHIGWYLKSTGDNSFKKQFNALEDAGQQLHSLRRYFQSCPIDNKDLAA